MVGGGLGVGGGGIGAGIAILTLGEPVSAFVGKGATVSAAAGDVTLDAKLKADPAAASTATTVSFFIRFPLRAIDLVRYAAGRASPSRATTWASQW